jgi:hypothetical protein
MGKQYWFSNFRNEWYHKIKALGATYQHGTQGDDVPSLRAIGDQS